MSEPVVLVTGGAGNLGRAVTRHFLDAGWRVAVPLHKNDSKEALADAARTHPGRLQTFMLDLTTERGAEAAIRQATEWAGRLDAVAHLVGGWFGGMPLTETPIEAWDRMMDLNVKSGYLVARYAIPAMTRGGGGSLVFVSSRTSVTGRTGNVAYAVGKAALNALVEGLHEEHRAAGIRANAVLPGTIDTPANRAGMPGADASHWTSPDDIARVILFLAGDGAKSVSGALVPVAGVS
jgi:NAD(P)-dependent dehydrogenase (short-subunit alcohol dehydrogenase family)